METEVKLPQIPEAHTGKVSQSRPVSQQRPHSVRRSLSELPMPNIEQLQTAKALVEKAVKMHKIFSIQGSFPVIRAALRARGWVERRLMNSDLVQQNIDEGRCTKDDIHHLMSRLVRYERTYFYWTTSRLCIKDPLIKEQMINHYAKAEAFTTKVGLCENIRDLHWFAEADPDTFVPRCYRLGAKEEYQAFIDDFRRTACTSLLQCIVERNQMKKRKPGVASSQMVPSRMIDFALQVCQDHLDSLDHKDIDMPLESVSTQIDQDWSEFIESYYLAVQEGATIQQRSNYVDRCQTMLSNLRKVSPQMDIDGIENLWIIKPGAQNCGRGIVCRKRLDEILKLVNCTPKMFDSSNWVVQKYIERPLLIHNTKFDVRQWLLVTNWNPLTMWFYKKCYLRFSTQPYSVDKLDSSVHLCNNAIQKHFKPSPFRHQAIPVDNMWCCDQFRAFLSDRGKEDQWEGMVVPEMKQALIHALKTAQNKVEARPWSFELFGADFMLGEDLRPWLIEINANPDLSPSTSVTARLCPEVQEDTLRVVLDYRMNHRAQTGNFELMYKEAAVKLQQQMGVNFLMKGTSIKHPPLLCFKSLRQRIVPGLTSSRPGTIGQRNLEKDHEVVARSPTSPSKDSMRTTVKKQILRPKSAQKPKFV